MTDHDIKVLNAELKELFDRIGDIEARLDTIENDISNLQRQQDNCSDELNFCERECERIVDMIPSTQEIAILMNMVEKVNARLS